MVYKWRNTNEGGFEIADESNQGLIINNKNQGAVSDFGVAGVGRVVFSGAPNNNETLTIGSQVYRTDTTSPNAWTYSESFDNAAWTKTASTIGANTNETADPFGYNAADKVTTTNATQSVLQAVARTALLSYEQSIYVKAGTANRFLWLETNDGGGKGIVWFDTTNGRVVNKSEAGGITAAKTTMQGMGNGWYRCIVQWSYPSTTTGNHLFGVSNTSSAQTCVSGDFYYVFGGQYIQSTATAPYYSNLLNGSVGAIPTNIRVDMTGGTTVTGSTAAARVELAVNRNNGGAYDFATPDTYVGVAIGATCVISERFPSADAVTFTSTLTNATITTWRAGLAPEPRKTFATAVTCTAQDVTDGFVDVAIPFTVREYNVQLRTALGVVVAWVGAATVTTQSGLSNLRLDNTGSAPDFAATDVFFIQASS